MKIEQIREMSVENIQKEIEGLQVKQMQLRMGNAIGTVDNPVEIRQNKRTIARMKTILTEKQRANG